MQQPILSRIPRPVWIFLALFTLLAISLAFQPVRALAIDFLGLFRVQQVAVIPFNPANLPDSLNDPQFEQIFSDNLQIEELGEVQEAGDAAQASELAGFRVRLPAEFDSLTRLTVQPGARATFHVDLPRIRALLKEIGRADIALPDNLNKAEVIAELPVSVTAAYGECKYDTQVGRDADQDPDYLWQLSCSVLVQVPSPTISAPPGLDIDAIGKAYLMMTGMTAEEAEVFSQTVDWSTTLLIPIPNYASSEKVQVDGVEGVLVQQSPSHSSRPHYVVIWVKDGIVYALQGRGSRAEALRIANSLK